MLECLASINHCERTPQIRNSRWSPDLGTRRTRRIAARLPPRLSEQQVVSLSEGALLLLLRDELVLLPICHKSLTPFHSLSTLGALIAADDADAAAADADADASPRKGGLMVPVGRAWLGGGGGQGWKKRPSHHRAARVPHRGVGCRGGLILCGECATRCHVCPRGKLLGKIGWRVVDMAYRPVHHLHLRAKPTAPHTPVSRGSKHARAAE